MPPDLRWCLCLRGLGGLRVLRGSLGGFERCGEFLRGVAMERMDDMRDGGTAVDRDEIGRLMTERALRVGPLDAECDDGAAYWYLVVCKPGSIGKASRWLARRRFGLFDPMQRRRDGRSGWERVFSDYLFVFAWDIDKLRARILACAGVDHIVEEFGAPARIPDSFILELRRLPWIEDVIEGKRTERDGKRRRRRQKSSVERRRAWRAKQQHRAARRHSRQEAAQLSLLTPELALAGGLAGPERIDLLLTALQLTPTAAHLQPPE